MPTTKLSLPTIAGNSNADVVRDLNGLASAIDDKAGATNGLATLDATGKVPSNQLSVQAPADASTTVKGIVILEDSINSTSVTKAATPKAVKTAYDLATEAKTQANDQKTKWAAVIGSPLLASDTSTVLQSKTQTIKNDLATNLTAKGQVSLGNETLDALIDKVALVNTGKKFASGTTTTPATSLAFQNEINSNVSLIPLTISGLPFKPTKIIIYESASGKPLCSIDTEQTLSSGYNLILINNYASAIRLTGNATISSNGFVLPANFPSISVNWLAIE